ncbi:deSI-like protein At4g17486 isoform X2 [Phoenix dactylifera]|uniref:DeSI-like protein At4g17486 isoform X2 n=1 Tax=Phoenix dactylifera TaxID=42345 RepID=A0A8B7CID7_PHODC|nr:deSI-like protein At4g17486 isoform X2 [Phoenix dactylifera]
MGAAHSSSSSTSDGSSVGSPVVLNVYDLTPMNNYMVWFGIGIFHSGIEVHGLEYGFGAHDYPTSGVFEVEPRSCPGFVYRCSILLGHVNMSLPEFRAFLEDIAEDYHGDTYQVISKNCNHFTDDICLRLTGRPIPGWVNRLAHLGKDMFTHKCVSCAVVYSLKASDNQQLNSYMSTVVCRKTVLDHFGRSHPMIQQKVMT